MKFERPFFVSFLHLSAGIMARGRGRTLFYFWSAEADGWVANADARTDGPRNAQGTGDIRSIIGNSTESTQSTQSGQSKHYPSALLRRHRDDDGRIHFASQRGGNHIHVWQMLTDAMASESERCMGWETGR